MMRFASGRRILLVFAGFFGSSMLGSSLLCMGPALAATPPASKVISSSHGSIEVRIRVRLVEALPKAEIRGFDLSISGNRKLAASLDRMSQWEFRCNDGRIRATPITASGPGETLNLQEPVSIHTPAGFLSFGGKPYRDDLHIYSQGSFCEVVNDVDLEKYLDGLVNAEFSARWNEEAIEAQVVAARTYAYYQMLQARQNPQRHFDVDATVRDQVYDGSIREDFRASRAVQNTKGVLLTVGQPNAPQPIKAFYHSTCGGRTELPENVWGSPFPGFKRTVRCGFCNPSPTFTWNVPMRAGELAQALLRGARADGAVPGWPQNWATALRKAQLLDLRISHISPQGRVLGIQSRWADGNRTADIALSGPRFREWIGANRLKSAIFQVTSARLTGRDRIWVFHGRGYGHGVGLCQWGAKTMGEKGYKMAAILKHYYPDAILRRVW